jgi:hypothetical protein
MMCEPTHAHAVGVPFRQPAPRVNGLDPGFRPLQPPAFRSAAACPDAAAAQLGLHSQGYVRLSLRNVLHCFLRSLAS